MIVFALAFLLIIGAGFAFGLIALVLGGVLLALGIVSSSVVVGVLKRSVSAGVTTMLTLTLVAAGAPAGIVAVWIAKSFLQAQNISPVAALLGALGGVAAGLCIAGMFFLAARLCIRLFREKIARPPQGRLE